MDVLRHTYRQLLIAAITVIVSLLSPQSIGAQMPIVYSLRPAVPPDSVDVAEAAKKHFWRPVGEIAGFNVLLATYNRIKKGHNPSYHVTLKSLRRNLTHGFVWDNDHLITNTFAHPYHGSLYFNNARSSGYNFWQSGAFALGGSLMWEYLMESEYPSINDFVSTGIGGAAVGEVLYRSSDAVIDNRTWGLERVAREAAALVIDPMRGFNRIVTGEMWRRSATSGKVFGVPDIGVQFALGPKALMYSHHWNDIKAGMALRMDLEYGNRFDVRDAKPYDYFTMRAEMNLVGSQPTLSQVNIKGRLLGRELLEKKDTYVSLGLYQHFDYYDSDTIHELNRVPYKLGIPASLGAGVLVRDVDRRGWIFDAGLHANAVVLGGVLSDYFYVGNRCYNWASGFSVKGGVNAVFRRKKLSFSLSHEFYRLFTWAGYKYGTDLRMVDTHTFSVMGDISQCSFHISEFRADYRINRHLYASLVFDNYLRHTNYRYFPSVTSSTCALRIMATYKL